MEKQPTKPAHRQRFAEIIENWFPLTYVLNSLNRGMGMPDAYPFVLSTPDGLSLLGFSTLVGVLGAWLAGRGN